MKNNIYIILGFLVFSYASLAVENTSTTKTETQQQAIQNALPYKLEETLQTFTRTVHGGVQHVVVKSSGNAAQIKLIQAHLQKTAEQYRKGDFSTSERQHGSNMPGLAQLKLAKPDDIKFEYKVLDQGGQIHYSSEYPQFVQALHEWFDAQSNDHGNTVIPGHEQHHITPAQ